MIRLETKIYIMVLIHSEAPKISALSSGKNYEKEHLTGEKVLPSDQ